jgi:hypothetical protein
MTIIRALIICMLAAGPLGLRAHAQSPPPPVNFAADEGCGPYAWGASPASDTTPRTVPKPKRARTESFARSELFFGTNKPDGSTVAEGEWRRFLDTEVTPRFPDGLTVLTGFGQFRGAGGSIVQERSVVLILLYPAHAQDDSDRKIEEIRDAYKRAFLQESVLRVDDPTPARLSF